MTVPTVQIRGLDIVTNSTADSLALSFIRGYYPSVLDLTYKLRHSTKERRKWDAAAALKGEDLSEWMREALDERAEFDISHSE